MGGQRTSWKLEVAIVEEGSTSAEAEGRQWGGAMHQPQAARGKGVTHRQRLQISQRQPAGREAAHQLDAGSKEGAMQQLGEASEGERNAPVGGSHLGKDITLVRGSQCGGRAANEEQPETASDGGGRGGSAVG